MGMRSFLRALRFAWPYRIRIGISIFCALLAAALWSLNFTAIYPILKIFGTGNNLQAWVDGAIDKCQKEQVEPLERRMADLKFELQKAKESANEADIPKLERRFAGKMNQVESDLASARDELNRYHIAKRFIDRYCPAGKFETLLAVMIAVILAVFLRGIFEFLQESLVGAAVTRAAFDLRNFFFRKSLHQDIKQFNDAGTHETMTRMINDIDTLGNGMRTIFGKIIAEPLKALACIIVAAWINWQLTLVCITLVPFALLILTRFGRMMKRATRKLLEEMSSLYKILTEVFAGIRIVKAFAREPRERRRFHKAMRDYLKRTMWVVNLDAMTSPIIEVMTVVAVGAVFLLGAYFVLERPQTFLGMPLGELPESDGLMQLFTLLAAAADPVRRLSNVYTRIQSGLAAADHLFLHVDQEPTIQVNSGAVALARHHKDIEFRNVCFSYVPGQVLLEGIDLHIHHGEIIAIVGKNGCGKTSLLNLLLRFYDPDHGSILVDGHDLRAVNLRSLRKQIAIVTQDNFLFDDTIFNNIAYAKPNATREEVEAAARQAQAHEFIVGELGQGYDTIVGVGGSRLSGGQRQRICLARAFLPNPTILILDEFTNQTDPEAEVYLHRSLRDFRKGRTIFLISHRLHTLEVADRIVVLDEGRVAAYGTHAELMKTCAIYQRLFEAQHQRKVA